MSNSYHFLLPYLRGWPIIIGCMVLAYLGASKYLKYVSPMYESTAKLRLADLNEGVPNSNLFKDLDVFASTQKINAEIELLKSHTLLSKALSKVSFEVEIFRAGNLRNTELFTESPFSITPLNFPEKLKDKTFQLTVQNNRDVTVTSESGATFKGTMGEMMQIDGGLILLTLNKELQNAKQNLKIDDNYQFSILSSAKQISQISTHLDIMAVDKDIPVIRISYKSSHPGKAAALPNALAEAYIDDYIENKYGAANTTVDFLKGRIADISEKLGESEQKILGYRDKESITNIKQETETDLRKISQLKIQQTNLKMSLEAIRELDSYIQSGKGNFLDLAPNFEAFTDLLSTEMIKKVKQLQAEKKDLLLEYTEKDERVKVVDAKLNDISSYLIESIANTRKNLETKYANLNTDITNAEKVFIDVPEKERMLTILNREFEIYQQSYNFLNQKKIEAEIAKAAKIAFHRIITPAFVSKKPVSPNTSIIKIVSVILGMLGSIIFIFIVHSLKARVNNATSVEKQSMLPIAATIPKFKNASVQEHFFVKMLSEWEVKGLINEKNLICFTGFDKLHGSSFISKQISKVLSSQKRKTLIVVFEEQTRSTSKSFFEEQQIDEFITQITISSEQLKTMTTKAWQEMLKEKAKEYDFTLLVNSIFGQSHTIAGMASANLNIVCLDTRLTPAKLITEVDLIQQEYQLPNTYFALNRAGYNPSLLSEFMRCVKNKLKRFKRKKV